MTEKHPEVLVAGAGLAGSEAAWQLAERGARVKLVEMRPLKFTPAHETSDFAELVCSNSLKSESLDTGSGLLKAELLKYGSLLIKTALDCRVPAGGALAVDRVGFSSRITDALKNHPNITIETAEIKELPSMSPAVIATGPLTSDLFAEDLKNRFGGALYFADAISPIVEADSVNAEKGYFRGRYGKGGDDYLNLPLTEDEYDAFYDALFNAETAEIHNFEEPTFFEGCMPVEAMAARGKRTLLFGPMRPVGLEDPRTGREPYAVVQLRKENLSGTAYNIVGFQTRMKISEQKRVFGLVPGLEKAGFLRYGSVHRNTYINSPLLLDRYFQLKNNPGVFFAGQITGLEGYAESVAGGLAAALQCFAFITGQPFYELPEGTALGSLSSYACGRSGPGGKKYVPSNFHLGMLPAPEEKIRDKKLKKLRQSEEALKKAERFIREKLRWQR